jgi:hypothetical protein
MGSQGKTKQKYFCTACNKDPGFVHLLWSYVSPSSPVFLGMSPDHTCVLHLIKIVRWYQLVGTDLTPTI